MTERLDSQGEMQDAEGAPVTDPFEIAQIMRLDDALARRARGLQPDLDPREDPELADLVATALAVDGLYEAATDTHSFRSFQHRSRAAILHALEAEAPVPLRERVRVMVAAAAGFAAIAIGVVSFGGPALDSLTGGGDTDPGVVVAVPNLTHRSSEEQLDRLSAAVQGIRDSASNGQPLSSSQLREFTESAASFANAIESSPDTVTPEDAREYQQSAQAVLAALTGSAAAAPGAEDAAAAAAHAAEDGITVAARYLGDGEGEGEPAGTETPTPTETVTPEPTVTPSATPTGTPTGTGTVTPSPTPTSSPTATPTGSVTPTPTGTPTGTATSTPTSPSTSTPSGPQVE